MESHLQFVEQFFQELAGDPQEPSQKSQSEMIHALRAEIQGLVKQIEQPNEENKGVPYVTL